MAGNVIDIIIKANDQTGTTLNKVNSAFKSLTGFSLSAAGGVAAAGVAFQKLYQFVKSSVDETEKYVTSITDMSRVLGMSTEETSRLVQASDDLFISQEKLQTAMLAASRQGIDVSINGLKSLSDQYLKLNPGVDRAQFLMQKFGRSGADMGKLMEVGADGIDAATAAIADNLIVTADSAENIKEYKLAVDELNDAWTGVKLTVGNEVMPSLTALLILIADLSSGTKTLTKSAADYLNTIFKGTVLESNYSKHLKDITSALKNQSGASVILSDDIGRLADNSAKAFMSIAESLSQTEEAYLSGVEENNAEMLSLYEERARLISLGYSEQSTKIKEIDAALDTNAQKAEENAAAHELATRRIILSYAEQLLAADGLTQGEVNYLLEKGEAWGIYAEGTAEEAAKVIEEASKVANAINEIPELHITEIRTVYTYSGGAQSGGSQQGIPFNNQMEAQASGGPVFGNTPYLVGEQGPEVFVPNGSGSIVPNNALGGGSATISQSDMMYLGKIIASEIQKAIG